MRREKISRSEVDHLGSAPKRPVVVLPGEGRPKQAPKALHGDERLKQTLKGLHGDERPRLTPKGLHGDGKLKRALVLHGDGKLAAALLGRETLRLGKVPLGSEMHKLEGHLGGARHKLGKVLPGSGKPRLKLRALPGERLTSSLAM